MANTLVCMIRWILTAANAVSQVTLTVTCKNAFLATTKECFTTQQAIYQKVG